MILTISELSGWRGYLFTGLLGLLAATALPPVHFLPGILAFSLFAWRLEKTNSHWKIAFDGWLFGFGYHLGGLYWISNALLIDSDRFAWLIPFATLGLPAFLSLFPAILLSTIKIISPSGWCRPIAIAVLWSIADFLRGHIFTGFPWNLPAYSLALFDNMVQGASIFGAYGLSLLLVLSAVAPAIAFGSTIRATPVPLLTGLACCSIPLLFWIHGQIRLEYAANHFDKRVVIRIVQGNVAQRDKWNPNLRTEHIARYLSLSKRKESTVRAINLPDNTSPTVVIWPETAITAFLAQNSNLRSLISIAAPTKGSLISGALSMASGEPRKIFNSIYFLNTDGSVFQKYNKIHLVPFGEYVPFKSWKLMPKRIASGFSDFSPGLTRIAVHTPGLGAVIPLVCYEIIFPGKIITKHKHARPQAILNLTNDAWYGESAGPYQHLAISKMRAIEEGLPLLRAANTGISGIYDAFGRTVAEIGLNQTGTVDGNLPKSITALTVYARFGDIIYVILITTLLIILGVFYKKP